MFDEFAGKKLIDALNDIFKKESLFKAISVPNPVLNREMHLIFTYLGEYPVCYRSVRLPSYGLWLCGTNFLV